MSKETEEDYPTERDIGTLPFNEEDGELAIVTDIREPTKLDVLLGRGAACWNHIGNRWFRQVVGTHLHDYEACRSRMDKMIIVANIVKQIIDGNGRFLKKDPIAETWFTVGRKAAIEKVGHAIRDKRAMERKREYKDKLARDFLLQQEEAILIAPNISKMNPRDPTLHSQTRDALLKGNDKHGDTGIARPQMGPLSEMIETGWPRFLEPSATTGVGNKGNRGMPFSRGETQDLARCRMHHRMIMAQSSHELMTSVAMSSIRETEKALDSIRKRAEMTQTALRFHKKECGKVSVHPLNRDLNRISQFITASRGNSDRKMLTSLSTKSLERAHPMTYRHIPNREVPLQYFHHPLDRPTKTLDFQTQAALQTLQTTLGDKATANAIMRASAMGGNELRTSLLLPMARSGHPGQRTPALWDTYTTHGTPAGGRVPPYGSMWKVGSFAAKG